MKKLLFLFAGIVLSGMVAAQGSLPEPLLQTGTTTVVMHIEGDAGAGVMYYADPFTGEARQVEALKEGNVLTWNFEQVATQKLRFGVAGGLVTMLANPGDRVELTLDAEARKAHEKDATVKFVDYTAGNFMTLNNELSMQPGAGSLGAKNFAGMIRGMRPPVASIEAYVASIVDRIEKDNTEVDAAQGLSQAAKEALKMDNITLGLEAVVNMKMLLQALQFGPGHNVADNTDKLDALQRLDMTDPKLLYGSSFASGVPQIAIALHKAGRAPESGWLSRGGAFAALKKAQTREPLTDDDRAATAASMPYLGELLSHVEKSVEAQYNNVMSSGTFVIRDTPAYKNAPDVLDAIVAQYPGKVVFVDFWATWCGPCLQAMRTMRSLKPWMKENDIVSVYIAEGSSPKTRWTMLLPDIGGEHYYLTAEEWKAVMTKYNFSGIPAYVVFDKQGKEVMQRTGYPGNEQMQKVFEEAGRMP